MNEIVKKDVVVTRLSCDDTVPEKVRIKDIDAFNKVKKLNALQTLVNRCKEMQQGLVLKADFIKARDTIECVICHAGFHFAKALNSEGQCQECVAEIEKAKREKEQKILLFKKWKQLEKDLKKFNGSYIFLDSENAVIKRAIRLKDKKPIVFEIYRDNIYSRSDWHPRVTGYALRITSDKHGLEADRLKKDFDGKNVAESLHNKIEKLVSDYEVKIQSQKEQKDKRNKFVETIMKDLGVTGDAIKDCYFYPRGRGYGARVLSETKEVRFQGVYLKAHYLSGKLDYSIGGIPKRLTISQVKKISKLVNTF